MWEKYPLNWEDTAYLQPQYPLIPQQKAPGLSQGLSQEHKDPAHIIEGHGTFWKVMEIMEIYSIETHGM